MRKILIAVMTGLLLATSTVASAAELPPGGSFIDDDGSVHEGSIEAIAAEGITLGCNPPDNTRYCPDSPVTRGQMAAFLVRALTLTDDGGGNSFVDDNGSVFEADIAKLAAAGITLGCNPPDNTRYCPDSPVTRAQMATFLTRALELTPMVPPARPVPVVDVPAAARAENTSTPDIVIGTGTPQSCTSAAVVAAVRAGGVIVFDCGDDPVTIDMTETAVVHNWANGDAPARVETRMVVLDGGGKVTLSGGGSHQILSMNTCDPALGWTTSHCQDQPWPYLVVQNMTLVDGDATGVEGLGGEAFGGGAIGVRGGRLKVVNSEFYRNTCDESGPDVGGGAVRAVLMSTTQPVYIAESVFGAAPGSGNTCSNGGAVSGLHASISVFNSRFAYNEATGLGANPQRSGTPGGGNGGTLYADGTNMEMTIAGTLIEHGVAPEGGGAVFFVSNNLAGHLTITDSIFRQSASQGFWTAPYESIFYLGDGPIRVTNSTIE